MAKQPSISKSRYRAGLQCHKLLWFHYNSKEAIPALDESDQANIDQGHEVTAFARTMFPDGIEVGAGVADLSETIRLTADALRLRKPLFEAAFSANGGYARVDILNPVADGAWDLIEVKSTNELKDEHLPDIAFQAWVLTGTGLKIRRCLLCHINKAFVRKGNIDPHKFFTLEEVTKPVSALSRDIGEQLEAMQRVIALKTHPEVQIGPQCRKPRECPLMDRCWSFLPESNVLALYSGKRKGFSLLKRGITRLRDIPDDVKLTPKQQIQKATAISNSPHLDRSAIAGFLKRLEYPLHFLDFETFRTAIPMFDETRPHQQVPFQFSLHLVRTPDAGPEHRMFLAEGRNDPRLEFICQLKAAIEPKGSVVIFNAKFELARLKECAEFRPEHAAWVDRVKKRVVDLLVPFSKFHYYHPAQGGSASMKAVLPALTGKGYETLEIQKGDVASHEFLRVTFGKVSPAERAKVRKQLEDYCGLDTMGMARIVRSLRELSIG